MKRYALILAALMLAASCSNFNFKIEKGDGTPADKTFQADEFDSVLIDGSLDMNYTQDPGKTEVILHADQNLIDYYDVNVTGKQLEISLQPGKILFPVAETYADVCSPALKYLKISGSGSCSLSDLDIDSAFTFLVSGSGSFNAQTVACRKFEAEITGSGDIKIGSLTADDLVIEITGSGNATVYCEAVGNISVRISGSGDVTLSGKAQTLNTKITGSGNIDTRRLALSGE